MNDLPENNKNRFDQVARYDDISAPQPNLGRTTKIDSSAEADVLGIKSGEGLIKDEMSKTVFKDGRDINLMDVLSGKANITRLSMEDPRSTTTSGAGGVMPTVATGTPTPSTSGPDLTKEIGLIDAEIETLIYEIKKLKEELKVHQKINDKQKSDIDAVQEVINNMLIQDSKIFDEEAVKTVNSQKFFFDLRNKEASMPPEWA